MSQDILTFLLLSSLLNTNDLDLTNNSTYLLILMLLFSQGGGFNCSSCNSTGCGCNRSFL